MDVLDDVAQSTGKKPMYAFNVSGTVDHMLSNAEAIAVRGGTCVMVTVGLNAVEHLRRRTDLAIHGHRVGFQALSRSDELGMEFSTWQKLARLTRRA
jgi:ribulose-bisphosphate carboxylase large chain